jgi:molybdopterin-guanine dinucleotide biosynthesis protein A
MAALLGAVLCGGASTRMGVDKATLEVDGVPMASLVVDVLVAAGCSPVVAIGGDSAALRRHGIDCIEDEFPGEGPLGGVLTALSLAAPAVIVACDLPYIRAATVEALLAALAGHDAAIARTDRAHPLCAVWSSAAAPLLMSRFLAGERSMHRAIEGLDVAWVEASEHDLRNVNTPADLHSL